MTRPRPRPRPRPRQVFDAGLQQERTSLAWERTAVSMMVAGVLLARYAAQDAHPVAAVVGVAQTIVGGAVLVWSGLHYDDLHDLLRAGGAVTHPTALRLVAVAAVVGTTAAFALAAVDSLSG